MIGRLFIMLVFLLSIGYQCAAQGGLLLAPTRIVFEGSKQKETLNLLNKGKDTATYSISFVQYSMKEDGSIVIIEKPDSGQRFADPYLRIFPRRVTLAPGEPQLIMLQCRRTADMPEGEFRSHLYFRAEKSIKPAGMENYTVDSMHFSVHLIPVFGLSIPVIIRSGSVNVSSTLSDLKLETQQESVPILKLTINRTGNISVYGDILIEYIPVHGKPNQVGEVKGVGVYTNINRRNVIVKLKTAPDKPLTNGKLKVQYVSNGATRRVVYAKAELDIKN